MDELSKDSDPSVLLDTRQGETGRVTPISEDETDSVTTVPLGFCSVDDHFPFSIAGFVADSEYE